MTFLAELVAGMLAHMAADRSMSHSLNDAREAVCKNFDDGEATYFIFFSYHMLLVTR